MNNQQLSDLIDALNNVSQFAYQCKNSQLDPESARIISGGLQEVADAINHLTEHLQQTNGAHVF